MNPPATLPRWTQRTTPWTPPLVPEDLADVLAKARQWTPFDGEGLLDDVGAVLDDVVPLEEDLEDHARRLRGHLMRLVDIAIAAEVGQKDVEADRLIRQARDLRAHDLPGDHRQAVGQLRRMAWSVNELLERLAAIKCLKEAA
ncbi:DUF6415 family natural product biosynthesis protein [Streptomyces cadmiisoli]|uniref:Uncharacterized protein n=1 Tax=Streptomyces cadmiisoli TaxID=2184053 RepID=A0A2Z4JEF2_9ACTN|nr:DUF6415 family natural product biosynthesis protein [Streptomyces cadmiisoli]AWW43178.1 hypothetical protein DN051_41975 [Streptomyces cadmiisoli]